MRVQGYARRKWTSRLMLGFCVVSAALCVGVLGLIVGYTLFQGFSSINLDFITQAATPVGETGGGMRNEIIGTLIVVSLAAIIGVPAGLMTGVFLSEFAGHRMAGLVRIVADVLTGVPSIVVGVFAYALLVRPFHSFSALSAGAALAVIMVPVIARTAEESLKLVPHSQREAALALGIRRWRATLSVVIPGAITGIATGAMLAIARVAGETAPLIFTALGSTFGFEGLGKPVGALPLQIWRYATSPYKDWQRQAWAGALVLVLMILAISILVRWFSSRKKV